MIDQNDKKQNQEKTHIHPVAAGVAGAVVGAGVAVAGVVALKDKKNREKVKEVLTNVKDQAIDYVEDLQKQAMHNGNKMKNKLTSAQKEIGSRTKKAVHKSTKKIHTK